VAKAVLFVSAAAVTPLVVPWSVVVEPVVLPMVTVVVLPAAPPVAMATALVEPETVAPVKRLKVDAAVPLPSVMLLMAPVIGPVKLVVPFSVVVIVPDPPPILMLFVEPAAEPVPMEIVRVEPEIVAPVPMPMVEAAVVLPKTSVGPVKVLLPE
jgi:hypothetical protein